MLSSAKLGCLFSVGLVVLSLLLISVLGIVGHLFPQEPQFDLPRITGRDLQEVARAKKSTAGGLDGWAWNEIKALPLPWFSGLAILLELVETTGVWPQGLLDAYIAMIPKADGDSLLLANDPSVCSPLCTGCGLPSSLDICGSGLRGGYLDRCSALVMVCPRWRPGSLLLWILKRFSGTGGDQLHVMAADVIKSFDTVDQSILDCVLGRLGLLDWFRKVFFSFHSQVRLRFKLAAGLGEPWCRDGGVHQGCLLIMVFCSSLCPLVSSS